MKLSRDFAKAIGALFVIALSGLEMPAQNPVAPPPCSVTITGVTCVLGAFGPIYTATAVVTDSLGCANQTLTITKGAGASFVSPATISPVTSGSPVSFVFTASGPSAAFNFTLAGCGSSCSTSETLQNLPTNCTSRCFSLSMANITCAGAEPNNQCKYTFTMNVISTVTGTLSFLPAGIVSLTSSAAITNGVNTVTGTITEPCGTTSVNLNAFVSGTNCSAPILVSLPNCAQQSCLSLDPASVNCTGIGPNDICTYSFTLNVINNSGLAGTVTITSTPATVTPPTFPIGPGANTITGTISVPCGTPSVVLTGTLAAPIPCSGSTSVTLPPCNPCQFTATADTSNVCPGGPTTITITPAPVSPLITTWYMATAPCPSTNPPSAGWTSLGASGAIWSTLGLLQTTCYAAVISGPGCQTVTNVVTVLVPTCSSSITSSIPDRSQVCSGAVVNLAVTGSPGCNIVWQRSTDGGLTWTSIGTGLSLPPQTLTSSACVSTVEFQAVCTCGSCPPTTTGISFQVSGPSQVGTLKVEYPERCAGEDDVLMLSLPLCGTVQWQMSPTGVAGSYTDITNATSFPNWNTNPLFTTTWYRAEVTNSPCAPVFSNPVMITVDHPPTNVVVTPPGPLTFCATHPVVLSVTMSSTLPAHCQWFMDGIAIPGATGSKFTATQTGEYCAVCTNHCGSTKSNCVCLLEDKLVVTIQGPCATCGGSKGCITLSVARAGCFGGGCLGSPTCGLKSYLWTASSGPAPTPNNTATVTVCPTKPTTTYTVTVTDACGCKATASQTVQICNPLVCRLVQPERRKANASNVAVAGRIRRPASGRRSARKAPAVLAVGER